MKLNIINSYTYKNIDQEILHAYFFTKDIPVENKMIWLCIKVADAENDVYKVMQPETILNQPNEIIELIVKRVLNNYYATTMLTDLQLQEEAIAS